MKSSISSLISEFEPYREAVKSASLTLRHEPVMAEGFGAQPNSPQMACRQGLRSADFGVSGKSEDTHLCRRVQTWQFLADAQWGGRAMRGIALAMTASPIQADHLAIAPKDSILVPVSTNQALSLGFLRSVATKKSSIAAQAIRCIRHSLATLSAPSAARRSQEATHALQTRIRRKPDLSLHRRRSATAQRHEGPSC